MSKRAEEAALKALPKEMIYGESTIDGKYDGNATPRYYFTKGYEQAEIDLILTADDVKNIFNKVRNEQVKYSTTEGCYQEVADWFNKQR